MGPVAFTRGLAALGVALLVASGCGAVREPGRLVLVKTAPFDVEQATSGRLTDIAFLARLTFQACEIEAAALDGVATAHGTGETTLTTMPPQWFAIAAPSSEPLLFDHVNAAIDAPPVAFCSVLLESGPFYEDDSLRLTGDQLGTSTLAFEHRAPLEDPFARHAWLPATAAARHDLTLSIDAAAFSAAFDANVADDDLAHEIASALSSSMRLQLSSPEG